MLKLWFASFDERIIFRRTAGPSRSHWICFPMFEYWWGVKWFQFGGLPTGAGLPGRPVGDLEHWDSCALGLLMSTTKGSGYQPLPSAEYSGLCWSLSRCSNPLDFSPCYSNTSTRECRELCLGKACQGLHLFWWAKGEKNVSFQSWLLSVPGRGRAPSAPRVVYGSWQCSVSILERRLLLDLLMASVCERGGLSVT